MRSTLTSRPSATMRTVRQARSSRLANCMLTARKADDCSRTIKARIQAILLTCAFTVERVTGIEPALSAWESVPSGLLSGLTCGAGCPRVTVTDRSSPWLMAR
jgi:hypothetical protein